MIDHFTRIQFELALPRDKQTGAPLWRYVGIDGGEHVYKLLIPNPHAADLGVIIRSSVHEDGHSAGVGEDSIRVWLQDGSKQMGSKMNHHITRVKGWEGRLTNQLRLFYRLGMKLSPCPTCGQLRKLFRCRKSGPNKGRLFQNCTAPAIPESPSTFGGILKWHGSFEWLTDPKPPKPVPAEKSTK